MFSALLLLASGGFAAMYFTHDSVRARTNELVRLALSKFKKKPDQPEQPDAPSDQA